jgi:hypothetical protein
MPDIGLPETPDECKERKTFNRRARTGWASMALVTVAFYLTMAFKMPLEWFQGYALIVGAIAGFVIGGISITDAIQKKG